MRGSLELSDDSLTTSLLDVTLEVAFLNEAMSTGFAVERLISIVRPNVIQCVPKLGKVPGAHLASIVLVGTIGLLIQHKRLFQELQHGFGVVVLGLRDLQASDLDVAESRSWAYRYLVGFKHISPFFSTFN